MSSCGTTHHEGCACWEEKHKAEVERAFVDGARAMKAEMMRIALRVTDGGQAWPELVIRLKEATVHEGEDE